MSIELRLLAYSIALLLVMVAIQGASGIRAQGLVPMAGNRDHLKEPSVFQARSKRAVDNLREGLWLFAPLVLIAALTQISNDWTALGARLFFYGRIAHGITYLVGIPFARTLAWAVALAGCILIFLTLFGVLV